MAVVLLLLLFWLFQRHEGYVIAAVVVHLVCMTIPGVFRPVAVVWFGASHLLGSVVSRVLLAAIFFTVVTPIGLVRRIAGADSLRLRAFKRGSGSVMLERNHTFTGKDLERPY
jgi:uncharacterized membrane protein YgdD (TMEM256/DUF423 family)